MSSRINFKNAGFFANYAHGDRWIDKLFTGHITIGPVTIYGANAMHWAVNVWFRDAYWCFHPTTRTFRGRWPWCFYISKDGTPQGATLKRGPGAR